MVDLLGLGEDVVRRATSAGAEEAEAFLVSGRRITVEVEKGEVKTARSEVVSGVGVRSVVRGKVGFAYATSLADALEVAEKSVRNAVASRPDPHFRGLPDPGRPTRVEGLFDPRVAELDVAEAVEYTGEMISAASSKRGVVSVGGAMSASAQEVAVVSSRGVGVSERRTSTSLYAFVAARDGDRSSSGFEVNSGRFLREINPTWVGSQAGELASALLDAVRIETGTYPMVLDPLTMGPFIGFLVSSAANGENVVYGRSFLTGKLGQRIASEAVTLLDDGTLAGGEASASFDGEGIPTRRTPVVEGGVLTNYIHNSYTAGRMRAESTGNATRSFDSLPGVGSHNVVLEAPKLEVSEKDLLDVRRGILLKLTEDRPNLANGEFSGMVYMGFLIEDGEVKTGVKEASFGIRLVDLMKGIEAVGREKRSVMGVISSPVRVASVRVAGPS